MKSLFTSFLVAIVLLLSGCAGRVLLPDEKEVESIRAGNKVVVLIRHSADIDSKPVETLGTGTAGFSLQIARLDTLEPITAAAAVLGVSPTVEARSKGWMYLLLSPGNYYLQVVPAGATQNPWSAARDACSGRWGTIGDGTISLGRTFWFHIPDRQPVVYIGSLSIACKTGRGLFGNLISQCSEITVKNETDEAEIVARDSFAGLGPLKTIPLQQYAPPASVEYSSKGFVGGIYEVYAGHVKFPAHGALPSGFKESEALYPMGISVAGVTGLKGPDWMKHALSRTVLMGSGKLKKPGIDIGGSGGAQGSAAIVAAYVLFYLPPATLVGTIWGQSQKSKWEPCMTKLAGYIGENSPAADIQSAIGTSLVHNARLRSFAASDDTNFYKKASESGLKSVLRVEVAKIQLRECEKMGTFFVETILRSSLMDIAAQTPLYNRIFLYSVGVGENIPFYDYDKYPYLLPLSITSPCREMEKYCGEGGEVIFKGEISRSIWALLQSLQPDLDINLK